MSDVNEIVEAYINVRNERDRITKAYEDEDKALKSVLETLQASLLSVCNEMKVESLKTESGTVFKTLKERFYTNDWDNFNKFVVENNVVDLLEKRLHQTNMKTWLAEHAGEGLPPGLQSTREYAITVRKPSK
jgi:hypothetical protein